MADAVALCDLLRALRLPLMGWSGRAPRLWRPLPASIAEGAGARPDHPINGHSVGIRRVQERFWYCQSVPMRGRVLSAFDPWCPSPKPLTMLSSRRANRTSTVWQGVSRP
jgi:hypothetical protein